MQCTNISHSKFTGLSRPLVLSLEYNTGIMVIPWKHLKENHYDHVHMRSRAVLSEDCTVCIASYNYLAWAELIFHVRTRMSRSLDSQKHSHLAHLLVTGMLT